MKTIYHALYRTLGVLLQAFVLIVALDSCNRGTETLAPLQGDKMARSGGATPNVIQCPIGQHYDFVTHRCVDDPQCGEGYHYDNHLQKCVADATSTDCSQIDNITDRERNRVVAVYGADGGYVFDQISTISAPNYSQQVSTYLYRIRNAVIQAGNEYVVSLGSCDNCTGTYDSSVLLSKITNYVTPVKNDITNDSTLSSTEKTNLLGSIQAIYDNYSEINSLVEGHSDCFPDPSWYGTSSLNGPNARGFFSGLVKVLKKVAQIVVTVITNVVDYALLGAAGSLLLSGGNPAVGALGLFAGAAYGLVRGIVKCIRGEYTCFIGICP